MRKRTANGAAIRAIRELVGISISAFAPRCGVSQGYMSALELEMKQPSTELLARIARELGVPLNAISTVCQECAEREEVSA